MLADVRLQRTAILDRRSFRRCNLIYFIVVFSGRLRSYYKPLVVGRGKQIVNYPLIILITTMIVAITLGVLVAAVMCKHLFFRPTTFTPENAKELLAMERPEEWNEVRIAHAGWTPDLTYASLKGLSLQYANFRDAILDNVDFTNAVLDSCIFERASLRNANFSGASLTDASFANADLKDANFRDSSISRTSLTGANLTGAKLDEDVSTGEESDPHVEIPLTRSLLLDLSKDISGIDALNGREFEELVAQLFQLHGFDAQLTTRTMDGGYDIIAVRQDPFLGSERVLIETKHYSPERKVGIAPVRVLAGALFEGRGSRGVVVTTSGFTKGARNFAEQIGKLKLIDRDDLASWIVQATTSKKKSDANAS